MLCEQIEEKKGELTNATMLSSVEETDISFSVRGKVRVQHLANKCLRVATQNLGDVLPGAGGKNDFLTSKSAENESSPDGRIDMVQDRWVSWTEGVYFDSTDLMLRGT